MYILCIKYAYCCICKFALGTICSVLTETDVFLDDVTVPEAEQKLNCKILVSYNGYDLAEKIAGVAGDEQRNNRNGGFYETDSCNSW